MKTIAQAAYDALDPDLKNLYQEREGAYHLAAVPRSVNNGILESKRAAEAAAEALKAKYGDIDPVEARKAMEALKSEQQRKAVEAGEFEKVLSQKTAEYEAERTKIRTELEAKLSERDAQLAVKLRDEELLRAAIAAGVSPEFYEDVQLHGEQAFAVKDGKLEAKGHDYKTVESWLKAKLAKKAGWLGTSTGGDTPPRTSNAAPVASLQRSKMNFQQKADYQTQYGMAAYNKLPK
jgi:hypothetical protein